MAILQYDPRTLLTRETPEIVRLAVVALTHGVPVECKHCDGQDGCAGYIWRAYSAEVASGGGRTILAEVTYFEGQAYLYER